MTWPRSWRAFSVTDHGEFFAANQPYWFTTGGGWTACAGDAAVWTWFGINDTHFTMVSYPGEYGDQCNDFWLDTHSRDESATNELGPKIPAPA